jgi:glycosyltransferase involved in cell wall biosynthesis
MQIKFSIIVPVYNRPDEVAELLESITKQTFQEDFEVVIVEDGSTISAKDIVDNYKENLNIS